MRKLSLYRLIAAYSLLLVLALPMGIQGLHPWLDEHEQQAHCDQSRGQIHIHDQSYAFDHCFLCAFHFSQYSSPTIPDWLSTPGWDLDDLLVGDTQILVVNPHSNRSSRAPPVIT